MTDFRVREANVDDMPAITAIYTDAVLNDVGNWEWAPPTEVEMTRRWRAVVDGEYPYLVAARDQTVLGFAYAGPFRIRTAYNWSVETSVYTHGNARRLGAGRRLMDALEARCVQQGFRQAIAVIGNTPLGQSVAFHAALGYHHAGRLSGFGWKKDAWHDLILMQKALGEGDSLPAGSNPLRGR